jgi:proline-specific peptidase
MHSEHKIPVEGGIIGSVRVDLSGVTNIPLIYINGGPGGTYLDEKHGITKLAGTRDVILYDQLGSYHSPAAFDLSLTPMERFVEELKTVLDHYALEKAILLGHSFGGSVAADFALTYPDRCEGVILSSPLLSTPRWIDDANILLDQMPEKERNIIRRQLEYGDVEVSLYEQAERLFYNRHLCRLNPWPERLLQGFSKSNKALYEAMWGISEFTCTGTLKNYDRFEDLRHLRMPVLLTCGRHDEARPETLALAAGKIKNAKLTVFEKSSHTPLLEETDTYLAEMQNFIGQFGK